MPFDTIKYNDYSSITLNGKLIDDDDERLTITDWIDDYYFHSDARCPYCLVPLRIARKDEEKESKKTFYETATSFVAVCPNCRFWQAYFYIQDGTTYLVSILKRVILL